MRARNKVLGLSALALLAVSWPRAAAAVPFRFTLERAARTSAGVFARDGALVRTLWSGVSYDAGPHAGDWDGNDEQGRPLPHGRYEIRVASSGATYQWEGVLGNTSDASTGSSVFHFFSPIAAMAVAGKKAFIAAGYEEVTSSQARFATDDAGKKVTILRTGAQFRRVASDGERVYWAGEDPVDPGNTFVMATRASDDAEVTFDPRYGGKLPTRYAMAYASAIDAVRGAGVSGLAVQRARPFLFVAREGANSLHVVDKTTGRLVRAYTFDHPGDLAVDDDDALWMIHTVSGARVVQRWTSDAAGALAPGAVVRGLERPLALGAARGVLVADGGTSQQVKAFDRTGAPLWVLGRAGGYARDPQVTNDRFDFEPDAHGSRPFVAFQPDGSFWVGDPGCQRLQRFRADRTFIGQVAYLSASYSTAVDPNAPTRVFSGYLEFAVDYALPLGPRNGSWRLVRNWRPGVPPKRDNQYGRMRYVTTLANGRTYAVLLGELFELPASGPLRATGKMLPGRALRADGSVPAMSVRDGVETWTERRLVAWDADGDPVWGEPITRATAPLDDEAPRDIGDGNEIGPGVRTQTGVLVAYDAKAPPRGVRAPARFHLGGVREGGVGWSWRASRSTRAYYRGPWPDDGTFDVSQGAVNPGGALVAVGRHILCGYRGEGWHGTQTNKWRHYLDDGLFVDEFGVLGTAVQGEAPPEMAGNVMSAWLATLPDGRVYLYHNDESWHGGVHRWRIEGLDRVGEQKIGVDWRGLVAVKERPRGVDLLAGLPRDTALSGNAYGWTVDPQPDGEWYVATGQLEWREWQPIDLGAVFKKHAVPSPATLSRALPAGPGPRSEWSLAMRVSFQDSFFNHGRNGGQYLDVLDDADRVIARFYASLVAYPGDARIFGNADVITKLTVAELVAVLAGSRPLTISGNDGRITVQYGDFAPVTTPVFDTRADWRRPSRLRLSFWNTGADSYRRACDLTGVIFRARP